MAFAGNRTRAVFASGGVIALMSLVAFLTTELFVMKSSMDRQIQSLREELEQIENNKVNNNKYQENALDEVWQMKHTLNDELGDLHKELARHQHQLDRHHAMIQALTSTVDGRLNTTLHNLNETFFKTSKEVRGRVFNLTQDVRGYENLTSTRIRSQSRQMRFQSAGTFAGLGGVVTLWHVTSHLRHYHEPVVQRKIMAILWMCPVYAFTSWVSLWLPSWEAVLALLKDIYEAYCLYTFLAFLIAVLGRGDRVSVVDRLAKRAEQHTHDRDHHPHHHTRDHDRGDASLSLSSFPFYDRIAVWCGTSSLSLTGHGHYQTVNDQADALLLQCQMSAMQFVLIRPITSILLWIVNRIYGRVSIMNPLYPQFYLTMIVNVSVFVAFSGLRTFYHAVEDELAWCRPLSKFLCIKGVIFMTFWQSIALSIYASTSPSFDVDSGSSNSVNANSAIEWRYQTQNYLVCVEMFFFAVAHHFVFSPHEWEEGYEQQQKTKLLQDNNTNKSNAHANSDELQFGDKMALNDFVKDLKLILKAAHKMKQKRATTTTTTTTTTIEAEKVSETKEEGGPKHMSPLEISNAMDEDMDDNYINSFVDLNDTQDDFNVDVDMDMDMDMDMAYISSVLQEAKSLKLDKEETTSQEDNYKEML